MITEKFKTLNTTKTVSNKLATVDKNFKYTMKIEEILSLAYSKAGYIDGPAHTEIIIDNEGAVRIVEIAGRSGGFLISDKMIPLASGIDVLKITILQKISKLPIFPQISHNPAILYFVPSVPGTLVKIDGIAECSQIEGVFIQQFIHPGFKMSIPTSDADRILAILVTGETMAESELKLEQALDLLRVVVK